MSASSFVVTRSVGSLLRRFVASDRGATSIEYAVIASGVALAIVVGIESVGTALNDVIGDIGALF
jgi:Flp pilus assembly pilin Flp